MPFRKGPRLHPADLEYNDFRPLPQPTPKPAWLEVNALFRRHGLAEPPTRLRDTLVGWLLAHRASHPAENGVSVLSPKGSDSALSTDEPLPSSSTQPQTGEEGVSLPGQGVDGGEG